MDVPSGDFLGDHTAGEVVIVAEKIKTSEKARKYLGMLFFRCYTVLRRELIKVMAMEAVKEVMKVREVRPSVLCDRLGIKSNVLSERFKQKNVSVSKLNEMLRSMDYKIVIVPRDAKKIEGAIEIE